MAFALTSFFADGTRLSGPGPYRAIESYVFTITGTTADVALDIGTFGGTFWTDAVANATTGAMAAAVQTQLQSWATSYQNTAKVYTPELQARIQAAATSGTAYTLSVDPTSLLPIYTFAASNGATAYTVFVDLLLKPNLYTNTASYNVQI